MKYSIDHQYFTEKVFQLLSPESFKNEHLDGPEWNTLTKVIRDYFRSYLESF